MSVAVQTCNRCSRVNPRYGVYCFACGVALDHTDRQAIAIGSRPFPTPFVFPSGTSCRTFDELASACQNDWAEARELLRGGYFESFLAGMGRLDLAQAAKQAARFPDADRALDQFLSQLPSSVLPEPLLRVEPRELTLGVLEGNQPRQFLLELENQGARLVYGIARTDCTWLSLGDSQMPQKAFQFTSHETIVVHLHPERLRASNKPLQAKIVLSSNAGEQTVTLRAEKPIKPFEGGLLTGAKSPRQIAELAMKDPKAVSPFFEQGAVERWYAENGWVYPVKIPAASGLAAIQQFFEALGVTRPPRVEIDRRLIRLQGSPGQSLLASICVRTEEKRPVFAHVTCNVPWIEVGRPDFAGKQVTVPLRVPRIPASPGQTLQAELTVQSNGNVRWQVPVLLEVTGQAENPFDFQAKAPPAPDLPAPTGSQQETAAESFALTFTEPPPPPLPSVSSSITSEPRSRHRTSPKRRSSSLGPWLVHALPALGLVLLLVSLVILDRLQPILNAPEIALTDLFGPRYDPKSLADPRPRVGVSYGSDMRFGIVRLDQNDPNNPSGFKRLTFSEFGQTNSTMVNINGFEYRFGDLKPQRDWVPGRKAVDLPSPYLGRHSTFRFSGDQVEVTQYIQIVPGQTNLLDTVLVYYRARNYGTIPRKVQIRLLLDTYIGTNDGVPFLIPGKSDLTRGVELKNSDVPEYLEVIENPEDAKDPGTIVRLGLRGLRWGQVEPLDPAEVVIAQKGNHLAWRPPFLPISTDSAVTIYWPEVELAPGKLAHFAITYGLGTLEISNDLGLSAPGFVLPEREFTVTAYVYKPSQGQTVSLELPPGMRLAEGESAVKTVPSTSQRVQLYWRVRPTREGEYLLQAQSQRMRSRPVRVVVKSTGVFG